MRKQSLRRTTLLSLIGLKTASTQSTSSWGTPFSVDSPSTATLLASNPPLGSAASSTEALVSTATPSPPSSEVSLISGTRTPSDATSFTVTLPTPTGSGTTVSTPISQSVTVIQESSSSSGSGSAAAASSTISTGGAAMPTGYIKMSIAGAIAGAAGVFMV